MKRQAIALLYPMLILMCTFSYSQDLDPGVWRGIIAYGKAEVPFNFTVEDRANATFVTLHNGNEDIRLPEIRFEDDSLTIPMRVFDADIKAYFTNSEMHGYWQKNYLSDFKVPFHASSNTTYRFKSRATTQVVDVGGKWEMTFTMPNGEAYDAVGLFRQNGSQVTGTILTTLGDYRYLEGVVDKKGLFLSIFDGAHGYLFSGIIEKDGSLSGAGWFQEGYVETWTARRNENATLEDPFEVIEAPVENTLIDLQFPTPEGKMISTTDSSFVGKILVVQVFGTWCSNSLDQTRFLTEWIAQNPSEPVQFLAVNYDAKSMEYGMKRILQYKDELQIPYPVVYGGGLSKSIAAEPYPFIDRINAFPTLIITNKQGYVRYIHSYFTGPSAPVHYDNFRTQFNTIITELLQE